MRVATITEFDEALEDLAAVTVLNIIAKVAQKYPDRLDVIGIRVSQTMFAKRMQVNKERVFRYLLDLEKCLPLAQFTTIKTLFVEVFQLERRL